MIGPRLAVLALLGAAGLVGGIAPRESADAAERELRVCADPNNLLFSNQQRQGFENRIAELVAEELDARLSYTWWAQRRGFIRNTLNAGACDLVIGVPAGYELFWRRRVTALRPWPTREATSRERLQKRPAVGCEQKRAPVPAIKSE